MKNKYEGWELEYFDIATNFRKYQFQLIKNSIKGHVAEVGPGNGIIVEKYQGIYYLYFYLKFYLFN